LAIAQGNGLTPTDKAIADSFLLLSKKATVAVLVQCSGETSYVG